MKFFAGLVLGLAIAVALPLAYVASGAWDVAATAASSPLEERLATWALDRSVAAHAPASRNPVAAGDAGALVAGLARYRETCVVCHGAPGVDIGMAGRGLNPVPPPLDGPAVQRRTDGQLFWIVKNGIRMSGMPAFGPTQRDEDIWTLVAAVRRLPRLTAVERAALEVKR